MHETNPGTSSPDGEIRNIPNTETPIPVVRLYYTPLLAATLDRNPAAQPPVHRPTLPTESKQENPDTTQPRRGRIRSLFGH